MIKKRTQKDAAKNVPSGLPVIEAVQKNKDSPCIYEPEHRILHAHKYDTAFNKAAEGAEHIEKNTCRRTAQKREEKNVCFPCNGNGHSLSEQTGKKAHSLSAAVSVAVGKGIHAAFNGNFPRFHGKLLNVEVAAPYGQRSVLC